MSKLNTSCGLTALFCGVSSLLGVFTPIAETYLYYSNGDVYQASIYPGSFIGLPEFFGPFYYYMPILFILCLVFSLLSIAFGIAIMPGKNYKSGLKVAAIVFMSICLLVAIYYFIFGIVFIILDYSYMTWSEIPVINTGVCFGLYISFFVKSKRQYNQTQKEPAEPVFHSAYRTSDADIVSSVPVVEKQSNLYDELTKLKMLLDEGIITQEEFDQQKNKILNK